MKIKIGNAVVETDRFEMLDGKVVPVIQATAETIQRPDGGQDVIIHAPCLTIGTQKEGAK